MMLMGATTAMAKVGNGDTLASTIAAHSALMNELQTGWQHNPALMAGAYEGKLSQLSASWNYAMDKKAVVMQQGRGQTLWSGEVKSYLPMGRNNTLWGGASYRNGMRRDILWNSTADYALLYPYVMADTLGGNLHTERYTFYGGCATRLGRWTIGESINFRAEHEYRTYDPRPRSIATELHINAGVARQMGFYRIGATVGGIFYKQTNDVTFYKEEGVVPEYQMTGLGSDYKRFSGNNTSAYYKATGWMAGLTLTPNKSGAYLAASIDDTPYHRIMTSLNDFPITTLYLTRYRIEAGWKHRGQMAWSAWAAYNYDNRQGDETIAGTSSVNEYPVLGHLTMYKDHLADASMGTAMSMGRIMTYTIALQGGLQDYSARYVFPERHMAFSKVYGKINAQMAGRMGRHWLIDARINAGWHANTERSITMPQAYMEPTETRLVNEMFSASTANYLHTGASAKIHYLPQWIKGYALFVQAAYIYMKANNHNNGHRLTVSVGVAF